MLYIIADMENSKRLILLFLIGAAGYPLLEILWRGYSHWTMSVVGGICLIFMFLLNDLLIRFPVMLRSLACTGIITLIEFTSGCLVNRILGWHVWDYSHIAGNMLGQVCPSYILLWFFIALPVSYGFDYFWLRHRESV